jgi:hypothetical protein
LAILLSGLRGESHSASNLRRFVGITRRVRWTGGTNHLSHNIPRTGRSSNNDAVNVGDIGPFGQDC